MRIRTLALVLATMFALASAGPARAVLLTLDPAAQTVGTGASVALDLNVSGLSDFAAPSLGAWDVDIDFDPTILSFTGAIFGNQLDLFGLGGINGVFDLGGIIDIFEVSLDLASDLDTLQAGAFTLATLSFDAIGVGTSALTITIDDLSDADGAALGALASGASVTVTAPVSVPEPGTYLLFFFGLAGIAALRRFALQG